MSEQVTDLVASLTIFGIGLLMILAGVIILLLKKRRAGLCTEKTTGKYIKHQFNGNGVFYPKVGYTVNGIDYKVSKKFRAIVTKSVTGLPNAIKPEAWEDEKGRLVVKRGSSVSYSELAEKLWPLGGETTVWYDPNKPKRSYVERPVTTDLSFIILVSMGAGLAALGVLIFFLTRYC